jgi:hypothetical protein
MMRWKIWRDPSMASMMVESPGVARIRAAAARAASVAPLTATPQSACLSAGASLTPSPVTISTRSPCALALSMVCLESSRGGPCHGAPGVHACGSGRRARRCGGAIATGRGLDRWATRRRS